VSKQSIIYKRDGGWGGRVSPHAEHVKFRGKLSPIASPTWPHGHETRRVDGGTRIVNKIAFQEWLLGEHEAPRAQPR
jgi:hypothetical protein